MIKLFSKKTTKAYELRKGEFWLTSESYEALPNRLQGKLTLKAKNTLVNAYAGSAKSWVEVNKWLDNNGRYSS